MNYRRAGELLGECRDEGVTLHSTWDVVSETVTLLAYRLRPNAAIAFLKTVKPELVLVPTTLAVLKEAERVFVKAARRRRLSFCDAISFVVVTAILDSIPCLSFDRDFRGLGLTVLS